RRGRAAGPVRRRLLAARPGLLRARAGRREAAGTHSDVEHRPPAVERHRPGRARRPAGQPPARPVAVLRLGRAYPRRRAGRLQPAGVPQRHRLAARHRDHRGRAGTAWAAATPLLLLRALLGLEPDGDHLRVDPVVPDGIGRLALRGIPGRWERTDAVSWNT